jgi:hypothetical protein
VPAFQNAVSEFLLLYLGFRRVTARTLGAKKVFQDFSRFAGKARIAGASGDWSATCTCLGGIHMSKKSSKKLLLNGTMIFMTFP